MNANPITRAAEMMTRIFVMLTIVLAGYTLAPGQSGAATINPATCSLTDVQGAVNSAAEDDTVLVPAGECTWASDLTIPVTKGLTLKGAGLCTGSPCTWRGGPTIHGTVAILAGFGKTYRVTGISFDYVTNSFQQIRVRRADSREGSHSVRIDNNRFNARVYLDCWCWGVVDHNEWSTYGRTYLGGGANTSVYTSIMVFENAADRSNGGGDGGYGSFKRDLTIGTAAAWYIEDNYFHWPSPAVGSSVADSRSGGRQIFRHNTVINNTWGVHDARTGRERGTRQYEVYSNTFEYTASIQGALYNFGSGSGYIYNNRAKTPAFSVGGITMQNWRSVGNILPGGDPWGKNANGTRNGTSTFCLKGPPHNPLISPTGCNAPYAGPQVEMDGYGLLYNSSPASCSNTECGYPARDQIGAGKTDDTTGAQTIEPVYFSDNYYCTGAFGACNPEPPASGGTGVYMTPLVSSMVSCAFPTCVGSNRHIVDGRDYFSNTTYPGYTPYTYPHPLAAAGPLTAPPQPTGLRIVGLM